MKRRRQPLQSCRVCPTCEDDGDLTAEIAKIRTERALTIWLAGNPYAEPRFDAKGELVEPSQWRTR